MSRAHTHRPVPGGRIAFDGLNVRVVLRAVVRLAIVATLTSGCGEARRDLAAVATSPTRSTRQKPNVIVIVVDTLRADRLSEYGYTRDTSTPLAPLSRRATMFTECYSPAAWTAPAVASLFSGLSPTQHGVDRVGAALGAEIETLAEALQSAGFDTAAFSYNPHVSRRAGFDQGFAEFTGYQGKAKLAPDIRRMLRDASAWIATAARTPFFLYLQPMNVHGPYSVPEDAEALLLGRPPRDGFEFFGPLMKELMNKGRIERREEVTAEFLESLSEKYDTAIRHTAEELGAFFVRLEAAGLFDDALIVLTSDHGEELFDHGGFAHRYSLHREILHVPLFVKLPGQRASAIVTEPVGLTDVHTTLLDWLDLAHEDSDAASLVPFLEPDTAIPDSLRERAFVAVATNEKRCVGRALRRGRHALLEIERSYESKLPWSALYDLSLDPGELHDLGSSHPALRATLGRALSLRIEADARTANPAVAYPMTDASRAALEALGYTVDPAPRD